MLALNRTRSARSQTVALGDVKAKRQLQMKRRDSLKVHLNLEYLEDRLAPAVGDYLWVREFGTSTNDEIQGMVAFGTDVYVTGSTQAALPGQTYQGGTSDAFIRKFDSQGNLLWTRQFGTNAQDSLDAIAVDANGIYVAGTTSGTISGQSFAGYYDAAIYKFDHAGNLTWAREFGTPGYDDINAITVDNTGIYVTGETDGTFPGQSSAGSIDVFVHKFDFSGNQIWATQFGNYGHETGIALASHATGLYLAGRTTGAFSGFSPQGSFDAFVRKMNPTSGVAIWTTQFGCAGYDQGGSIIVDDSGVYVGGTATGTLNVAGSVHYGESDAFLRKLDHNGVHQWLRQYGTSGADTPSTTRIYNGEIYLSLTTTGTFSGQVSAGSNDLVVMKLDLTGAEIWTKQIGSTGIDIAQSLVVNSSGIIVGGYSNASFPGQSNTGSNDALILKLSNTPANGDVLLKRQFGTSQNDGTRGVASDGTNTYVVGQTSGAFPGFTNAGSPSFPGDAFVQKYDAAGNLVWTRQFGTAGNDYGTDVLIDGSDIYVIGAVGGALPGQTAFGSLDAFIRKYDSSGTEIWTRQFGSNGEDYLSDIAADASGIYLIGYAKGALPGQPFGGPIDAIIRKYDRSGNELQTVQLSAPITGGPVDPGYDVGRDIAVDATGVYVAGVTTGTFPGQSNAGTYDVFVVKYNHALTSQIWVRQFGSIDTDTVEGLAVDVTGVYVGGNTYGQLPGQTDAPGRDPFVRKYDTDGNTIWTRQFGGGGDEYINDLIATGSGPYVAGATTSNFAQPGSFGGQDAFVTKFTITGNQEWSRQIGTSGTDGVESIALAGGQIYLTGGVTGAFPFQTNAGGEDAFLITLDTSPTNSWTNPAGGDWHNPANWILGVVPADGDRVFIPDSTGPITYFTGATSLRILTTNENLIIAGGSLTVSETITGLGQITVNGGTFSSGGVLSTRPTSGPIAYWKGDGDALDLVGGKHGTPSNGATFAEGKFGQAFSFDGSSDFVSTSDVNGLNINGSQFTIEGWVRKVSTGGVILWKGSPSGANASTSYALIDPGDGRIMGIVGNGSTANTVVSSNPLPLGQFVHVAFAANGSQLILYFNGVVVGTAAQTLSPYPSSFPVQIGGVNGSPGNTLNGQIDGLSIYNRLLLPSEIQALASPQLPIQAGGTLAGNPIINADVVNAGTVAPGSSPGVVTVNGNYSQTGTLAIEIQGTNASTPDFDQLIVNGAVTLGGLLDVSLLSGFTPTVGNTFKIIDNDDTDPIVGTFNELPEGSEFNLGDQFYIITYVGGTGNDVVLTASNGPTKVTSTTPSLTQGIIASNTSIQINFCEPVNGATTASNYELRGTGSDGLLGTADDALITLMPTYSGTTTTLTYAGLSAGTYRLTVKDTITSTNGPALDGNDDNVSGGNWVRDFVVGGNLPFILDSSFGGAVAPTTYPTGAVSRWLAENNANDSVGSNHGTLLNGTSFTPGINGSQAFNFDGINDYISIPDSPSLNITGNQLTVTAWVMETGNGGLYRTIIEKGIGGTAPFALRMSRDRSGSPSDYGLFFRVGTTNGSATVGYNNPQAELTPNLWYHVVGVYDGSALKLYLNGSLIDQAPLTGDLVANNMPVNIGANTNGTLGAPAVEFWNGKIDDVALFGRALTAGEVVTLYNSSVNAGNGIVTTPMGAGYDYATQIVRQPDGKIVAVGVTNNGTNEDLVVARYLPNGQLDPSFGSAGKVILNRGGNDDASKVALQSDGKIVIVGTTGSPRSLMVVRLNSDGTIDTSFDTADGANDGVFIRRVGGDDLGTQLAIQPDGKIIAAGFSFWPPGGSGFTAILYRFNLDGSYDNSFGTNGLAVRKLTTLPDYPDYLSGLVLQSDGKMVLGANFGGAYDMVLARLNSNGSFDTSFGSGGKVITNLGISGSGVNLNHLALQPDGKIIGTGNIHSNAGYTYPGVVARWNANGSIDTTFGGGDGVANIPNYSSATMSLVESTGRILVSGVVGSGTSRDVAITALLPNGSVDTSFNTTGSIVVGKPGVDDYSSGFIQEPTGKLVIYGYSGNSPYQDFALTRIDPFGNMYTPNGLTVNVISSGAGAGQLVEGTNNAFDGLGRLEVSGVQYTTAAQPPVQVDNRRTLITPTQTLSGLNVSREITVPGTGSVDFARTVDVYHNPTGSPIATIVRIVGNLGSDSATTVFNTSDGDSIVETTDQWIGTDDVDGIGTPAIIHYIHGPNGLQPTTVNVTGDNIEWIYSITVAPGQTLRLVHYTILANDRATAVAGANTLITSTGFGGEAATYLTAGEIASLANMVFNTAPIADAGGPYVIELGSGFLLDGSNSTDPDVGAGDAIVRYEWDLNNDGIYDVDVSTPTSTVSWAMLSSLTPALSYPGGSNTITLRITDSFGLTHTDSTTLSIYLNEPVASFLAAPNPAAYNQVITFDASGSYHQHPGRVIVAYEWDFNYDGVTFDVDATGVTTTHSYPQFGTYTVALRVRDDNFPAHTALTTQSISVSLGNHIPVAEAGGPYTINPGENLTLDASASFDLDVSAGDALVGYTWDLDNDGQYDDWMSATPVSVVPWTTIQGLGLIPGTYNIGVRVTDTFSAAGTATTSLTMLPGTLHWQGDVNDAWSNPANWLEGVVPTDGVSLVFDSTTPGFTGYTNNDLTGLEVRNIVVSSTVNFTLVGNGITLAEGINSTGTFTYFTNAGITLLASQTFSFTGSSTTLRANVDTNGFDLTVTGTGNRFIDAVVSGSGNLVLSGSSGSTYITKANTYSGLTTINASQVTVQTNGTLGDSVGTTTMLGFSSLWLSNVTTNETIQMSGSFSQLLAIGTTVLTGNVILATTSVAAISLNSSPGSFTISGNITGTAGGSGLRLESMPNRTLLLSGTNTYTGNTVLRTGIIQLGANGVFPDATNVTVEGNTTLNLAGFNETVASITNNGTVLLGGGNLISTGAITNNSVIQGQGVVTSGNFTQPSSGTLTLDVAGTTPGTQHGQVNVIGTVTLAGALNLNLVNSYVPSNGNRYVILSNDGTDPVTGTFNGLPEGHTFLLGGMQVRITYAGGDGNDVEIIANQPPVADAGGPYTLDIGANLTLDGSASYDPDSGDAITSYAWDLDNDGQYDDWSSAVPVTVVPWSVIQTLGITPGSHTIGLRVTDTNGATGEDTATLTLSSVLNYIIVADNAADEYTLRQNGAVLELVEGFSTLLVSYSASAITAVFVNGADDEGDLLTVDYTFGGPFAQPITFAGGAGAGDALTVLGGTFTSATNTMTGQGAGSLNLGSTVVAYSGAETVTLDHSPTSLTVNLPDSADTATLQDAGTDNDGVSQISSTGGTFADFIFRVPSTALSFNTGAGDDAVTVAGLDSTYTGNLTINGADRDTVNITGTLSLNQLIITTTMLDVNAPLTLVDGFFTSHSDTTINAAVNAGAGGFDIIAGRSIFVNANITVTGGNTLSLNANAGTGAGVVDAHRDPGAAVITMGAGTMLQNVSGTNLWVLIGAGNNQTYSQSGDITLNMLWAPAGHVLVRNQGTSSGSDILNPIGMVNALSAAFDATGSIGTTSQPIVVTGNAGTHVVEARAITGDINLLSTADMFVGGAFYGGLAGISAPGVIRLSAGNITINESIAGTGDVVLQSNGNINGAIPLDVSANLLTISAAGEVVLGTSINSLSTNNSTGTMVITDVDAIILTNVRHAGMLIVNSGGAMNVVDIESQSDGSVALVQLLALTGNMTVGSITSPTDAGVVQLTAQAGSILDGNGAGNLNLTTNTLALGASDGISLDVDVVSVGAIVTESGGTIQLTDLSGGVSVSGTSTNNGNIWLTAQNGSLSVVNASTGSGNLTLQTSFGLGDVFVDSISTTGLLTVISTGSIEELGNDATVDISAESLNLTAQSMIGALGQIELDITNLTAATAGAGSITLSDDVNGFTVIGLVQAPGTVSLLAAETGGNADNLTIASSGQVRSLSGNVILSAGDTLVVASGASLFAGGSITLNVGFGNTDDQLATATINGQIDSANPLTVIGGSGPDRLQILTSAVFTQNAALSFSGGAGIDQLAIDRTGGTVFNIDGGGNTATNQGSTNSSGLAGSFTSVESLIGGAANDTFAFFANRRMTGSIDGAGGNDTLTYANRTAAVTVDIQNGTATATGGILSLETFIGSTHTNDVLVGPDLVNTWQLTGNNAGTLNGTTTYSNFENLTGGIDVDTFSITGAGGLTGILNGGAGSDFLVSENQVNTWNLSGPNAGNLNNALTFSSIENLTGGSDNDYFNFLGNNRSIAGIVAGNGGADTISYQGRTSAVVIDFQAMTATAIGGFTGVETFIGSSNLADAIIGGNSSNIWNLTGTNQGNLNGLYSWLDIENLNGGTDIDRFKFAGGGSLAGSVNGGGNSDILDYQLLSTPVTINLQSSTATGVGGFSSVEILLGSSSTADQLIGPNTVNNWGLTQFDGGGLNAQYAFAGVENITGGTSADSITVGVGLGLTGSFDGGTGSDTVVGPNGVTNTWSQSGINAGNLNGLFNYSNVENLVGGTGIDVFTLAAGSSITGSVDGAGGPNELNYSNFGVAVSVNRATGTATGVGTLLNVNQFVGSSAGTDTLIGENVNQTWTITGNGSGYNSTGVQFVSFEQLTGGSGSDRFEFTPAGSLTGTINGGGGTDTLVGKNIANAWNITADNAGDLNGTTTFTSIETLVGGNTTDVFTFANRTSVADSIDGGSGADSLRFTGYTVALTVDFESSVFTSGTDTFLFAAIEEVEGGTNTSDILVGPNTNTSWYITGPNAGSVNGQLTFAGFEQLTGGAANDEFVFSSTGSIIRTVDGGGGIDTLDFTDYSSDLAVNIRTSTATNTGGFANIENLIGGSGNDSLTGTNNGSNFLVTSLDEGTVDGINFLSFENLLGGTGADTFMLLGGTLTGGITGAGGIDTLVADNRINTWRVLTTNNAGTLNDMQFTTVENLTGGSLADTYIFAAGRSVSGVVTGGAGLDLLDLSAYTSAVNTNLATGTSSGTGGIAGIEQFLSGSSSNDTFTGLDTPTTWTITGSNEASLSTGQVISGYENLSGGCANDNFLFTPGSSISGNLSGNGGFDTVDYSATSTAVTINLQTSLPGIESIIGSSSAGDTLIAANVPTAFIVEGPNSGTVNSSLIFAGFENLTGGTNPDIFVFRNGSVAGVVNGAGGADSLDYTWQSNPITVNLGAGLASLTGGIQAIENLYGGGGSDTVIGTNSNVTWDITGGNAGSVAGVTFSGVENLTGGTGRDTFNFAAGFLVTGTVNGGSGNDTISGANVPSTWSLNGASSGNVLWSGIGTLSFTGIETLAGGTGGDTLRGENMATTWNVTGRDAGSILGGVAFTGIESLVGAGNNDNFVIAAGGSLSGGIAGGGGTNTLDYTAWRVPVIVNLGVGSATDVGSTVMGIHHVIGGADADLLIGNGDNNVLIGNNGNDTLMGLGGDDTLQGGQGSNILLGGDGADVLTGGTGRDLLIGGLGADLLVTGGGDDILIGGYTTFDNNLTALDAIMSEWRSGHTYAARISNITGQSAGGNNGTTYFNSSTVFDDGISDTLTGGGGRDWFFALIGSDLLTDQNLGGPEEIYPL